MVSLEVIALVLTGLGLTASIVYYTNIIRNTNKTQQLQLETRQAQLFMQIFGRFNELSFVDQINKVRYEWSFSDWDDFNSKYGYTNNPEAWNIFNSVVWYFEGLGVLIHRGLINPEMVDDLMSGPIINIWEKFQPIVEETRSRFDWPTSAEWFEYLYQQIRAIYDKQHPEYTDRPIRVFRK